VNLFGRPGETHDARVVWREPAEAARIRAELRRAGCEISPLPNTHWLNINRLTTQGNGVTRYSKALTDCGIAITGRINDPHSDNGMLMPSDTPITCSGCVEAQGKPALDAVAAHLAAVRSKQTTPATPAVSERRAA